MTKPKPKPTKRKPPETTEKKEPRSWFKATVDLIKHHGYKFYPVLFALFPLLSFYSANQAEIRSGEFTLSTFFIFNLVVISVIWPLAWLVTRSAKKASVLSVVTLAVFFVFGRVHDRMDGFVIKTPLTTLGPTKILLLSSIVLLFLAWFGIRRLSGKNIDTANLALTIVGVYLVFSTLFSITLSGLSDKNNTANTKNKTQVSASSKIDKQNLPDIYYILLDGYARADILKTNDTFNYDNSAFLEELKKRGFYVAEKANSNYAHTHWSVPSTFNMDYLNYLAKQQGEESNDRTPLRNLFHYNSVVPKFKSFGYKYVQIGSQWDWARTSPLDDIEIKSDKEADSEILNIKLDEFALVYLQTTALKPWISSQIRGTLLSRVLGAFERTEKISEITEPTLSFSHILAPHPPYLFNRNGVIPGLTDKLALDNNRFSDRKAFAEQTMYTNKLTLDLIDTILKNSQKPPIIIIASDHGPASSLNSKDFKQTNPTKLNIPGVKERLGILNAYFFPDQNYKKLYPSISPVNSFRLILSQYFGQNLELLPDRSYFSDNGKNQYRLIDVSDLVSN